MKPIVKIFDSPDEVADSLVADLTTLIGGKIAKGGFFNLAVSGGNTPGLLFLKLAEVDAESGFWRRVHIFWVDERCVPPDDSESNFGLTRKTLLDMIKIPVCNVHRMRGEDEPQQEALRYSDELREYLPEKNGIPYFDAVLLGLGEDGHTASIFPGHEDLFYSEQLCVKAVHPVNGQERITITGKLINNSENVIFMVTGEKKSVIIKKILEPENKNFGAPATLVRPLKGKVTWYVDKSAAGFLTANGKSLPGNLM
jgi:6-phosphogluconolactonase